MKKPFISTPEEVGIQQTNVDGSRKAIENNYGQNNKYKTN